MGSPSPVSTNGTVQSSTFGGQSAPSYRLLMDNNAAGEGYNLAFSFTDQATSAPVTAYNIRFSKFDIDRQAASRGQGGFQDVVWISGATASGTFPAGANTVVSGSGTAGSPWTGTGTTSVADGSNRGNVAATIASASSFTVNYRSGDQLGNEQQMGVGNIQFCR